MNADSVRPLVSSLFFSSSSASSSPLLPLSPLFSLSGFDPLTHQHAMATRHTRHGSVRMSKVHVMAFWGDQYVLYWISPMDAPRRELSAGILHATRTADARAPYNFSSYYGYGLQRPSKLLACHAEPEVNFLLAASEPKKLNEREFWISDRKVVKGRGARI